MFEMDIIQKIKEELQVEKWQVEAAVKLIDEGNIYYAVTNYLTTDLHLMRGIPFPLFPDTARRLPVL